MPADNHLYNTQSHSWWDEHGSLASLQALTPSRFGYMRRVLVEELGLDPRGKKTLDLGCGGGILAEEFARLGCRVTGLDPSEPSISVAREHARESGLEIEYRVGVGEEIPFPDGSFEIVYCCDTLEHVADLGMVISEIARVLGEGGIFLFDTINRTLRSWVIAIQVLQEWRWTSVLPPDLHDWKQFIKPAELGSLLASQGLELRGMTGLQPAVNAWQAIRILRSQKRGEISPLEAFRRLEIRESPDTGVYYIGWAQTLPATLSKI